MNPVPLKPELVAPCGMDCNVCKAYLAFSRGIPKQRGKISHCSGCRPRQKNCYVKRGCKKLRLGEAKFCYECADLPCRSISRLEKRYTERYATSFVANLGMIREQGMEKFLETEAKRFRCPSCSDLVSVHDGKCCSCGKVNKVKPNF